MALIKHIASKNADYSSMLDYLMFEHKKDGTPILDDEGNKMMRELFLLDGINCSPFAFDKDCEMVNAKYHKNRKYSDIKSHHYIISFDPQDSKEGKLTPELAQTLGMDFARKHFPGHQMLVCTHSDGHNKSGNIHVHIIFNSVRKLDVEKQPFMERDIDCRAGFKHHLTNGYLDYLQAEVMEMCKREGLHQVDLLSPAKSRVTDEEYRAKQHGQKKLDQLNEEILASGMKPRNTVFQTQKQFLRDAISEAAVKAASLEDFIDLLSMKYEIKVKDHRDRFSYLHPDRQKYITGRSLGSDFEKEHILNVLEETSRSQKEKPAPGSFPAPEEKTHPYDPAFDYYADPAAILYIRSSLRLVTDLQACVKAKQNAAYARKVKLTNLKEMARTIVYLQEHGFDTRQDLVQTEKDISAKTEEAEISLRTAEKELQKTNELIHFTGQYLSTKAVQSEFLNTRNKKSYRESHKEELDRYNEAIHYFKENTSGSVPSMKTLKAVKARLLDSVDKQKKILAVFRQEQKELRTAVSNVENILGPSLIPKKTKKRSEQEL